MSSGRTAGMTCRTTIRSMAFPASPPSAAHRSVPMVITAARASTRRGPLLVRRSTSRLSQARNSSTARAASAGGTPGRTTCHRDASSGSAPSAGGACITSITSIPSGRAASSRSRTSDTAHALVSESSKYSASLAAPGRGRASVRDLRVRRESGGIGDGQPCPANSPFNGTRDIPVTGETHPASFSVPDNQLAGHCGHARARRPLARRPLARHAQAPVLAGTAGSGSSVAPVGPVWISVPMAGQTPQS